MIIFVCEGTVIKLDRAELYLIQSIKQDDVIDATFNLVTISTLF